VVVVVADVVVDEEELHSLVEEQNVVEFQIEEGNWVVVDFVEGRHSKVAAFLGNFVRMEVDHVVVAFLVQMEGDLVVAVVEEVAGVVVDYGKMLEEQIQN
jgi:hypothetical protein